MSNSHVRVALPGPLQIPDNWIDSSDHLTKLAQGLAQLIESFHDAFDDLLALSDPDIVGNLWLEATKTIETWVRLWLIPISQQLEASQGRLRLSTSQTQYYDPDSAETAVLDFVDPTVTYDNAVNEFLTLLRTITDRLALMRQLHPTRISFGGHQISARPLSEIVMEAILLSRRNLAANPRNLLGTFPDLRRSTTSRNSLATRTQARPWVPFSSRHSEKSQVVTGYPSAMCALWTGVRIVTGSSLIQFGKLKKLRIGGRQLHDWFRGVVRRARFTVRDQEVIDALVGQHMARYRQEVDNVRRSFPDLPLKQRKVRAFQKVTSSAHAHIPATLPTRYRGHGSMVGQAYEGKSWSLKRKCCVCTAVYVYRIARAHTECMDWYHVGEESSPPQGPFGTCAEAIVFVLSLADTGLEGAVRAELGLGP